LGRFITGEIRATYRPSWSLHLRFKLKGNDAHTTRLSKFQYGAKAQHHAKLHTWQNANFAVHKIDYKTSPYDYLIFNTINIKTKGDR